MPTSFIVTFQDQTSLIRLPFTAFSLTSLGYEREVQRLNDSLQVEEVGLLVTSQLQTKMYGAAVYDEILGITKTSIYFPCYKW